MPFLFFYRIDKSLSTENHSMLEPVHLQNRRNLSLSIIYTSSETTASPRKSRAKIEKHFLSVCPPSAFWTFVQSWRREKLEPTGRNWNRRHGFEISDAPAVLGSASPWSHARRRGSRRSLGPTKVAGLHDTNAKSLWNLLTRENAASIRKKSRSRSSSWKTRSAMMINGGVYCAEGEDRMNHRVLCPVLAMVKHAGSDASFERTYFSFGQL